MTTRRFPRGVALMRGAALLALTVGLVGCGGGGGGGSEFVGAAEVSMDASPRTVDTGDRIEVSIDVENVHINGIALKIRFPTALEYVVDSGTLEVDGLQRDISPTVLDTADTESKTYLVYYFAQTAFGDDMSGTVKIQLEARSELESALVEVDPDVDDPNVSNNTEFDPAAPEFGAEDSVEIEVVD